MNKRLILDLYHTYNDTEKVYIVAWHTLRAAHFWLAFRNDDFYGLKTGTKKAHNLSL
ncbi:hypothetical protein TUM4644_32270 [Shewanella colwelliana]|uniref:Uncharacterized protein n=1 Tax=Shewanella colwelliana TaxID=23 RepID=A0ABQ4P6R9_SHECO|nr:hypothetical protein TUM4644_32270 [Shewanella colwelliana]GIU43200.1 hypothetical protein TUM3794_28300 [Shewanella colwelliana]